MYLDSVVDNNIIYSVDKLRLKTYITYSKFSELQFFLDVVCKDKIKKLWVSERIMCFKYNYNIEVGEGQSFYFGFHHNNEKLKFDKPDTLFNFTIEFNPNKLKDNEILLYILNISGDWYLKSLDLACDLKINILDLIFDPSGRAVFKIISKGYDDKTVYIGTGDRRVKVYNKKKESNLNILNDLTRIEISYQFDDFRLIDIKLFKLDDIFPNVYTNNYLYSFKDYEDKTLLAILFAVQNGFPIRDLTRRYKQKIHELLEGGEKVRFNRKSAQEIIRKVIFHYFIPNDLVHWH